jgi:hypothetical protein
MKWMLYSRNLEKQINFSLLKMMIFSFFYVIFDKFIEGVTDCLTYTLLTTAKIISGLFIIYFLVYSLLLTKRWVERKYK